MKLISRSIFLLVYTVLLSTFSLGQPVAPASKPILIRITLKEAEIIQQILGQIELATQEVELYLAITKPMEQLLATTPAESNKPDKQIILRLSLEATNNLLLFLQRANIPSLWAKQIDQILTKIEKSLPKGASPLSKVTTKPTLVTLHLNQIEARLTQQLLDQIDISVSEVDPFLVIYVPLEQENLHVEGTNKNVIIKLPEIAPRNLLLFLERTHITGQQAKIVYSVLQKLQRLIETVIATHNNDQPSVSTP